MNNNTKKIIKGYKDNYVLDDNFKNISGNAQWTYATGSKGKRYFIKKFYAPTFPKNRKMYTPASYDKIKYDAEKFYNGKKKLYGLVSNANTGNNVIVSDFFLSSNPNDGHYYAVSEKMEMNGISVADVRWLPEYDKLLLFRLVLNNFKKLHEQGIIYGDVRSDNILLVRSETDTIIPKLIDFDGSYLEDDQDGDTPVPVSEDYLSPEVYKRVSNSREKITAKSDIFSLGLLFHEYYTGYLPRIPNGIKYASLAVIKGDRLILDDSIPEWLREILYLMLQNDPEDRPSAGDVMKMIENKRAIYNPIKEPASKINTTTDSAGGKKVKINFGSFSR